MSSIVDQLTALYVFVDEILRVFPVRLRNSIGAYV